MGKRITLEDIFNDDEFGLLDSKPKDSNVKTENQRLIESFEEINDFYEKNNREPQATNVTEFKLLSRLKALRNDPKKIEILKSIDPHNLLNAKEGIKSVADILNDDDLGILDTDETLSIFELKNVTSSKDRAETDFAAQRQSMTDVDFESYERMFKSVQAELRQGKRELRKFKNPEKNLIKGNFYILDGVLLYLEEIDLSRTLEDEPFSDYNRKDGRTRIIFENGTLSNMLYRSIGKQLLDNGQLVTKTKLEVDIELLNNVNSINEDDEETGWIYILKSKSTNQQIASIKNLYKIGYSTVPVPDRIKNASKEATYLMADVKIIEAYKTFNLNVQKFENLLHRFFGEVCLNVDIHDDKGRRITPREWFVVPLPIIRKVIALIQSGDIINYRYDSSNSALIKVEH